MIRIQDSSLRDGNHAVRHQIDGLTITEYVTRVSRAGVGIIEVGHGNGLGASSFQVGKALISDQEVMERAVRAARPYAAKIAVHSMPGFATIRRDLEPAILAGVEVFRVGVHCTEVTVAEQFIRFLSSSDCECVCSLMMSHMTDDETLLEQALLAQDYGATGVSIYDSAGSYVGPELYDRLSYLVQNLEVDLGFHAHNNLGLGISNSLAAVDAGCSILDASILGFGAGAGNAQLEVLVAAMLKCGYETGIDLYEILDVSEWARENLVKQVPEISSLSIVSGLAGVFSGFKTHVEKAAADFQVDPRDIFFELGKMRVVGGQEDLISEAARTLQSRRKRG